jgi:hypothetical protein
MKNMPGGKIFWLKVRRDIERQIERESVKSKSENEQADQTFSFPQPFNPNKHCSIFQTAYLNM